MKRITLKIKAKLRWSTGWVYKVDGVERAMYQSVSRWVSERANGSKSLSIKVSNKWIWNSVRLPLTRDGWDIFTYGDIGGIEICKGDILDYFKKAPQALYIKIKRK